jgi:hypothetical protein
MLLEFWFILSPSDDTVSEAAITMVTSKGIVKVTHRWPSSAGLRHKSDCSGKVQTKLYGVSVETAK